MEAVLTYYQLLGLDPNADADEIRTAYRARARLLHPDKHENAPAAAEMMRLLIEAHTVLSHPQQRAAYDQSGGRRVHAQVVEKSLEEQIEDHLLDALNRAWREDLPQSPQLPEIAAMLRDGARTLIPSAIQSAPAIFLASDAPALLAYQTLSLAMQAQIGQFAEDPGARVNLETQGHVARAAQLRLLHRATPGAHGSLAEWAVTAPRAGRGRKGRVLVVSSPEREG